MSSFRPETLVRIGALLSLACMWGVPRYSLVIGSVAAPQRVSLAIQEISGLTAPDSASVMTPRQWTAVGDIGLLLVPTLLLAYVLITGNRRGFLVATLIGLTCEIASALLGPPALYMQVFRDFGSKLLDEHGRLPSRESTGSYLIVAVFALLSVLALVLSRRRADSSRPSSFDTRPS